MSKKAVVELVAEDGKFRSSIKKDADALGKFGDSGMKAVQGLVGTFGKLAGVVGVGMGAMEGFQKTIGATQTATDEFGRIQSQVNAVVDSFFYSLATGSFDGFISGLKDVAKYGREAYNALDDLGTFNIFKGAELGDIDKERARLTAEIRSGKKIVTQKDDSGNVISSEMVEMTKDEVESAKKALEDYDKKRLTIVADAVDKETAAYNALLKKTLSGNKFKGSEEELQGAIDAFLSGYRDYSKVTDRYNALVAEYNKNKKTTTQTVGGGNAGGGTVIQKDESITDYFNRVGNAKEYSQVAAMYQIGDEALKEAMGHRIAAAQSSMEMNRMLQKDAKTTNASSGAGKSAEQKKAEEIKRLKKEVEELDKQMLIAEGDKRLEIDAEIRVRQVKLSDLGESVGPTTGQELLLDPVMSMSPEELIEEWKAGRSMDVTLETHVEVEETDENSEADVASAERRLAAMKEVKDINREMYDETMNAASAFVNLGNTIDNLGQSFENCTSAWDYFSTAVNTTISLIDGAVGIFETLNMISQLSTKAKQQEALAFGEATQAKVAEDAANSTDIVSEMASMAAAEGNTMAKEEEATASVTSAAAKFFDAHSWIPFVGVALGAAALGAMLASMMSLPKFAEGAYADRPTLGIFGEAGPELVLPERKLDEALERHQAGGDSGKVEFKIKSSELVGILKQADAKQARKG